MIIASSSLHGTIIMLILKTLLNISSSFLVGPISNWSVSPSNSNLHNRISSIHADIVLDYLLFNFGFPVSVFSLLFFFLHDVMLWYSSLNFPPFKVGPLLLLVHWLRQFWICLFTRWNLSGYSFFSCCKVYIYKIFNFFFFLVLFSIFNVFEMKIISTPPPHYGFCIPVSIGDCFILAFVIY